MIYTKDYNVCNNGSKDVTKDIQKLINENDELTISSGIYRVSNLYLKSNFHLYFEDNAVLIATTDESKYDIKNTRVAGIEMPWYLAILNIIDSTNVTISGNGIIDGNGIYWWRKYWGDDTLGGMRSSYDKLGLRAFCDYDCMRPRNLLVSNSKNIVVNDITSKNSGFWNIHILYSNDILINNVKIEAHAKNAPSTDGIDIDSSFNVTISNSILDCNDDSICIKSGRDYDGIEKNIPSHDIFIKDCNILRGYGITIGSEVSGGIYNVNISNINFTNTDCGFRIKSSMPRKGYIKDITLNNFTMKNVKYLFNLYLDWNPNYSICEIPKDYKGEIKPHYLLLSNPKYHNMPNTRVENIKISNIVATTNKESRAFNILGFKDSLIKNIEFNNMMIICSEYGTLNYTENITFNNTTISSFDKYNIENDIFDIR